MTSMCVLGSDHRPQVQHRPDLSPISYPKDQHDAVDDCFCSFFGGTRGLLVDALDFLVGIKNIVVESVFDSIKVPREFVVSRH